VTTGIYLVEIDDRVRYALLAETAENAVRLAARIQWPAAKEDALAEVILDRCTVGRLGDFDPGIEGARLVRASIIAIQHGYAPTED
jgi:hypothetical protein